MGDQAGMAEYVTVGSSSVYPLDGLSFVHGAIIEPLGVALDVTGVADIPLNSAVCVMGPGPIGLMAVRVAKLYGAKKVILVGNSHSKARLAAGKKLGADEVVHADKVDIGEYFAKHYPKGVERVIVTSPPKTILDAIKIVAFGGVIAFIGIDFGGEEVVTLNINQIHFKRLQLRASHAIPNTFFPIGIDLLKRKVIDPDVVISHTFPLDRAGEALTFAENNKAEVIKVVIEC
jgi:L-iditol 2-dehydrogenase